MEGEYFQTYRKIRMDKRIDRYWFKYGNVKFSEGSVG